MAVFSMSSLPFVFLLLTAIFPTVLCSRSAFDRFLRLPKSEDESEVGFSGTKWALLIAGSAGYGNYRHQADICHAYQLLKRGGLKDENIVVFMEDDIAYNPDNPYKGTIINQPHGEDVYHGVPKDYTGRNVSVNNFLGALKGDKASLFGGSGKVIESGPEDHVFVYYSDHGGPGILGMPNLPFLFANDIVDALKEKHSKKGYKELVFYLEACESGSIFEGLLPKNIDVYATTASNAMESSWGTYCPGMIPSPPPEFETCLGDLYSVAWMEDSDVHNLAKESLHDQYKIVKDRTSNHATYEAGSHVMQYGDVSINSEPTSFYVGTDPANDKAPPATVPNNSVNSVNSGNSGNSVHFGEGLKLFYSGEKAGTVSQRDAEMLHLWHKYKNAKEGSSRKMQALEEINKMSSERAHIDRSIDIIDKLLAGRVNKQSFFKGERRKGLPLVDDWDCLKAMVRTYESKCGLLTQYGMKHTRKLANLCNSGVRPETLEEVATVACDGSLRSVPVNGIYSA